MILSVATNYAFSKRCNKCLCDEDLFPDCDCGDYEDDEKYLPPTKHHKLSSPINHQLCFVQQYSSTIYKHYGLYNKHVYSMNTSLPTPSVVKELVEHYIFHLRKNRYNKWKLSLDIKVLDSKIMIAKAFISFVKIGTMGHMVREL
jgi:hypothetical protein